MPADCPSCEFENRDEAAFCGNCGQSLSAEQTCGSCGRQSPAGRRFCDGCGSPFAAQPEIPAPERVPRSYTPQHLADKILQSKSALEGERKRVTVMFADVKGSMELADQLDPEEWHRVLERFFEILSAGVHRFEGTVNQYTGDGIMALFGAPIAHEDHAQRACYAALQLREEIARYANEVKREYGLGFSTRMGLHSGDVVVGKIGDDLRMDYTAQGHTVGLAQRMEALASPDTCYLTEATASLVSGYFDLEDLGKFPVRGVGDPVRVHQLTGVGKATTRFDISRARGLTRFVGRDSDLATLESALEQARRGNGQVVGVVAEAGTGKSRLCFEFVEKWRARGMTINQGCAVAHGRNVPYLPMLQVFRAYYGIGDKDDDRTVREKIAGRMLLLDENFRDVLPVLFEFFGAPDPERPVPQIDPEEKQRQIFAVLRRIVQGDPNVTAGSFAVLLEDLHWLDPGSEAFLEQWVDAIAGSPALLLVNFRPEYHADWMSKSYYRQLPLAPLGPEAIRELLVDLLGTDPSTDGLAEAIHSRTGGNPFFTEEVVQTLIESGHLEGTRGHYRLETPIDKLEVPASVQSVLAARIDRLDERDKHVLQTAAVIGKEFSEPILLAAAELPDSELRAALTVLKAGEFVYEQSLYPIAEYAFKHPLTQEVSLNSQLQDRRRRTHAAVARAIEEASADKLDETAALLAHHWEEAGEALTAARWLQRAAEWVGRSNPLQAVQHMRRVLELTETLPESTERDQLRLDACRSMLQGGWRTGLSREEGEARFAEGCELAERLGDVDQAIGVRVGYGATLGFSGDLHRYRELTREAVELIDASTSAGAAACALSPGQGYALLVLGQLEESLRIRTQGTARTDGDPHAGVETLGFSVLGESMQGRAEILALLGRLDESRSLLQQSLQVSREHELLEPLAWGLGVSTILADCAGERADEARRNAFEATEVAERVGSPFSRSHAYRALALAHRMHGDHDAAIEILERAIGFAREGSGREREPEMLAMLAEALTDAGELDRAHEVAEEAVELARSFGTQVYECMAHLAVAGLELRRGAPDAADRVAGALDAAEKLVEQTGARALAPRVEEQRARLARLQGDPQGFASRLRAAHALYAEIGARGHAERVAAELEELP
jgi:adenylate cyclase